jgi:hypothetical protein
MNNRIYQCSFTLVAIVLLVAVVFAPAVAQESDVSDTFDEPALTGWETTPGTTLENGQLHIEPGNFAARMGHWSDFSLRTRFQYSGPGEMMVYYYLRDESRYTLLLLDGGVIILEKEGEDGGIQLGNASSPEISPGSWIDLGIVVSNGEHQILVGDELLLSATDLDALAPGAIGFQSAGERTVTLDDLHIKYLELPSELNPAEERAPVPGTSPGGSIDPTQIETTSNNEATDGDSIGEIIRQLFDVRPSQVDLQAFAVNLLLAGITSFVLSRVYIHWGTSLSNRRRLAGNFMLVTLTTTFIIMVVRSSVALSLGLVGALSIIRFRTAIKEPEELAYLFLAIGLGIGLGDNQRLITFLALAGAVVIIAIMRLTRKTKADVNLHLAVASHNPNKIELPNIMEVLETHCSKLKLLRFDETEADLEAAFMVEFRETEDFENARTALRRLSDALQITFLDNKGIW